MGKVAWRYFGFVAAQRHKLGGCYAIAIGHYNFVEIRTQLGIKHRPLVECVGRWADRTALEHEL